MWRLNIHQWGRQRILYRGFLVAVFCSITFYFGLNYFMFGKFTSLNPSDFISVVNKECLPIVRAMREYERDYGQRPDDLRKLVPKYLSEEPMGDIRYGRYESIPWFLGHHGIAYDFDPAHEGWRVHGEYANGPIPLPPVPQLPSTRPASRPH